MHYIYILTSSKNPNYTYVGKTTDLKNRLNQHNRGESGYSKTLMPWKLETYIAFSDKQLAEEFERYLKNGSGFAFMKKRFLPDVNVS